MLIDTQRVLPDCPTSTPYLRPVPRRSRLAAISLVGILSLGSQPDRGAEVTYFGEGWAEVSINAPAGYGISMAGEFAGPVTLDYAAGILTVVSSGLFTTSGTETQGQGPLGPPIVTDLTGTTVALGGAVHPFGPGTGDALTLLPWGVSLPLSSQISAGSYQYQGFSITGNASDLAAGTATMSVGFRLSPLFPMMSARGHLDLMPLTPPTCLGDTNCDGVVTFADIDPFLAHLGCPTGGTCSGTCPWFNADVNGDGEVTFADIDPFVARLGCSCQ